jgi:hypothetical protein
VVVLSPVIVGGDEAVTVTWSALVLDELPEGVVTFVSTVPKRPAGTVATIVLSSTTVKSASAPPIATAVALVK